MHRHLIKFAVLALALAGAGCGGNSGSGVNPPTSGGNLGAAKLQFAVGTATIGSEGAVGLNTVETLRQPNGLTAALVNTPTIVGPVGFTVPSASAGPFTEVCPASTGAAIVTDPASGATVGRSSGTDAGTSHISATPQVTLGTTAVCTSFGTSGGAFGYGFAPDNSTTSGALADAYYQLPFYPAASARTLRYVGGPPAFPQSRNGTFPGGFLGYYEGFTDFNVPVVAGAYTLNVVAAAANAPTSTFTATANLSNVAGLPTFPTPSFLADGNGGGTVTVNIPPGVTETAVEVLDLGTAGPDAGSGSCFPPGALGGSPTVYYTILAQGSGTQTLTLPDNIGPAVPGQTTHTLCTSADNIAASGNSSASGDDFRVYAVGFDYPAFEAAYPQNASQTPTIVGANGQADITTSKRTGTQVYP